LVCVVDEVVEVNTVVVRIIKADSIPIIRDGIACKRVVIYGRIWGK